MTAPSIGSSVHYTLNEYDANAINRRRKDFSTRPAGPGNEGFQAHVGNHANAGQTFPATVVASFGGTSVNLQVTLDGNDTYWATSRSEGEHGEHGKWTADTSGDPLAEAARLLQLAEKAAGTDVSVQLAAIADRWLTIASLR